MVPTIPATEADRRIREFAARQGGLVSARQLREVGVAYDLLERRTRRGWLCRLHRGVYRVGVVRGARERERAAALACGPTAVISHRSAAELWELLPARAARPVDVTIRSGSGRVRRGLRVHRSGTLTTDEVTLLEGVSVTTPPRTLVDLAGAVSARTLERAVAGAARLGRADEDEIRTLLERHPGRRGTRVLRALLGMDGGPAFTRSAAEARFLALVRSGGLAPPRANVRVAGFEVDFLWGTAHLVVEIDGYAFHRSREAFERDRQRDAVLIGAGFRVLRVTWRQLERRGGEVLVKVAQALVSSTSSGIATLP